MAIEDDILALCNTIDGKCDAIKTVVDNIYTAVVTNAAGTDIAADIIAAKAVVDAIKLKTDNLPSDPADESLLEAAITAAGSGGVFDIDLSAHNTVGTVGELLNKVNTQYGLGIT